MATLWTSPAGAGEDGHRKMTMMKRSMKMKKIAKYTLIPKVGYGKWYTDTISGTYVTAWSADGFETIINLDMVKIVKGGC